MDDREQALVIEQVLASERLSIDACEPGRTSFLTHVGATRPLTPGPWIAHRDLIYALALTNLSVAQRTSLGHAVRVEHGRAFGVGRCELQTSASGLPFGGANLLVSPKTGGPRFVYAWALGAKPPPVTCEWLLLRAQPEWALEQGARQLSVRGLETLDGLGGTVLVLVPTVVAAMQVMSLLRGRVDVTVHPRFAPLVLEADVTNPKTANLMLWPHDGLGSPMLRDRSVHTVVMVDADEPTEVNIQRWAAQVGCTHVERAACPGRISRVGLEKFWRGASCPKVLLRGDPVLVREGTAYLETIGATVVPRASSTQLGLF